MFNNLAKWQDTKIKLKSQRPFYRPTISMMRKIDKLLFTVASKNMKDLEIHRTKK